MKTLYLKAEDENSIAVAADILKKGGLVAIPTETVYGLAADALNPEAVKNIFIAKGRPQDNPLIVHVSSLEEIPPLVDEVDPRLYKLAEKFWPGPLTIILKKSSLIPDEVSAGLDTVAIRMPSHPIANKIIKESGVPLAAPSANASGRPSPTRASHVLEDIDGKIDAIVDGGSCSVGVESTVITLATEIPTLLRPGGVTPEELSEVLGEIEISHAVFEKLNEGEKVQSPGMKYKHYAPKAQVTIVKGSFENYCKFVKAQKEETCAVCFEGEGKNFDKYIEYGSADNSLAQAQHIFDALREVDAMGCKTAFVRCPVTTGVGLAVYNRLLRSAAFREINLDIKIPVYGLTGHTGAGKSTIGEMLEKANLKVIDTDSLARKAVESRDVIDRLCKAFGDDIIKDGVLDRKALARKAFKDEESTKLLNSITHPEITRLTIEAIHLAESEGKKGAVIDAPVLFESPLTAVCNKIICVVAPEDVRLQRIMERDGISREDALIRMGAQKSKEYYVSKSDFIIENNNLNETEKIISEFLKEEML